MTHDPLCPHDKGAYHELGENSCKCDFIAKVREDEANRSPEQPHDQHSYADNLCSYCIGFDAALNATEEAIRAVLGVDERNLHAELTALAAIDALRSKS